MQSPSRLSLLKKTSFLGSDDRVVIDFGSAFTKFGFSSEPTPRYIIPTKSTLAATFKEIFQLMIITDQGQRKVIVVEQVNMLISKKKEICDLLLENYNFSSVSFISASLLSIFPTGQHFGLVVDMGYEYTTVVPVYENIPLLNYHTAVNNAGSSIEQRLKSLLIEHGKVVTDIRQTGIPIDENLKLDWQDLTVRICRASETKVTPHQGSCKDLFLRINHNTLLKIPGWVRQEALEGLFHRRIENTDIPSKILECILKCPTDIRSEVCSNIVFVGGTSMYPLVGTRLHLELIDLTESTEKYSGLRRLISKFRYSACPFQPIIIPWIGGSLAGVAKMNNSNEMKRENYSGQVSDWAFDLHGLED